MDLKELDSDVDPKTHWYYQSKKLPLIRFIKTVFSQSQRPVMVVDVGSGSGFFMYELEETISEMISKIYLVDIGYSADEISATIGKKIEKTRELPYRIENAIVVMMDVLEHVEEDFGMLTSIKQKSHGRNHFLITVPAFMQLWSGHDLYLGHWRRYTRTTLRALLEKSDVRCDSIYYLYGLILPIVWMRRRLFRGKNEVQSHMKPMNLVANEVLKSICSLEMRISRVNTLAGLTVVAEGQI